MNSVGTMLRTKLFPERESEVVFGRARKFPFRTERLTESELNHHVHIVGASGFGKTVLLSHLIRQRIQQGKGLLFVDLKGDIETISKFRAYAAANGRLQDVQVLSLGHKSISSAYNLIGNGSATQIRDRIMTALTWSEEFYKNQSASFLLKLFIGLCWLRDNKGLSVDLKLLATILNDKNLLEDHCLEIPEQAIDVKQRLEELVLASKNSDYWNSLQGLRTQIESLVLSDFADLVRDSENGINLFKSVTDSKIVLLFLDTRRYGETAAAVGKFVLQDLKATSARIDSEVNKKDRKAFSVVIDEFADLAQEDFISFLDRARSSRMSLVVAHQEISDLNRISPEFAGRLMGNTATLYAFLQKRSESAEVISSIAGTKTTRKETERFSKQLLFDVGTGEKSIREVEEFIIHPNVVKSLRVGECVCVKKYPVSRASIVRVFPEKTSAS